MHRLFVALPIPDDIAEPLLDLMHGAEPLRWVHADSLHLTLRFIGEVDGAAAEDVAAALSALHAPGFTLRLAGTGQFHHRRSGVLWAGVAPKAPVTALAAKVERAVQSAGLRAETRAFHPHVTLARWSGPTPAIGPWLERHGALHSAEWRADRLVLFESHLGKAGPAYEERLEVPLL